MHVLTSPRATSVHITAGSISIDGTLVVPDRARGLVIFAQGSGSSRFSRRSRAVAQSIEAIGFASLVLDLLTHDEEAVDLYTRQYRFDIARLAERMIAAVDWVAADAALSVLPLGCFGASTGAAAALIAAAERPAAIHAIISRGGRPDLADEALGRVMAPTLLIVSGEDDPIINVNLAAVRRMRAPVQLEIIPATTLLAGDAGSLEAVSRLTQRWCAEHLIATRRRAA